MQTVGRAWKLVTIIRLNRGELNSLIAFASSHHEKGIRDVAETGLLADWAKRFESVAYQRLRTALPGELQVGWANQIVADLEVTKGDLSLLCTICEPNPQTMGLGAQELAEQFHNWFKSVLNDARRQQDIANTESDRDPPITDSYCYSLHDGGEQKVRIVDDFVDAIAIHDPEGKLVGFVMADHAEAQIIVSALNCWS